MTVDEVIDLCFDEVPGLGHACKRCGALVLDTGRELHLDYHHPAPASWRTGVPPNWARRA